MGGGSNGSGKCGGGGGSGKGGQAYTDWRCALGSCSYWNFGWRARCKACDALPPAGARNPKGSGKGANVAPGIAARQLQQQADAARREHQRTKNELDKVRKELAEAKRLVSGATPGSSATMVVDIAADDDEADDDDADGSKEDQLNAEVKAIETALKSLPEAAQFRATTQQRLAEAKGELQALREKKGGPGAKVFDVASRHQKELRSARTKLLKKTKAKEKLEDEVREAEDQLAKLRERLTSKQAELGKMEAEVQEAHGELERLTRASADEGKEAEGGAGGGDGRLRQPDADDLLRHLSLLLPPSAGGIVADLRLQAEQFRAQQQAALVAQQRAAADANASAAARLDPPQGSPSAPTTADDAMAMAASGGGAGAAEVPNRAATAHAPPAGGQSGGGVDECDGMDDLDPKTVELLGVVDAVLDESTEGAKAAEDGDNAARTNRRRIAWWNISRRGAHRLRDCRGSSEISNISEPQNPPPPPPPPPLPKLRPPKRGRIQSRMRMSTWLTVRLWLTTLLCLVLWPTVVSGETNGTWTRGGGHGHDALGPAASRLLALDVRRGADERADCIDNAGNERFARHEAELKSTVPLDRIAWGRCGRFSCMLDRLFPGAAVEGGLTS